MDGPEGAEGPDPDAGERTVVELGPSVDAARVARETLRQQLGGVAEELVDTACLLADELVANVLLHVGAPSQMVVVRTATEVRVEVADHSPQEPARRSRQPDRLTGRGLHLLDEMATSWGSTAHGGGKTVWFTLRLT